MDPSPGGGETAPGIDALRGLDSVDGCRLRLLSLRTRIETNWPSRGFMGLGRGLSDDSAETLADMLLALPTPLPITAGTDPVPIVLPGEPDLRAAAARAVDAGLALLAADSLEVPYPGTVSMLGNQRRDARGPIAVTAPSVGLLVATIIGTLEAISERIGPAPRRISPPRKKSPPDESGSQPGGVDDVRHS